MSVGHDTDAIGDAENLRHLGGDNDDRLPLLCHLYDQLIDLILGAHIDAAGGFVHQEHRGIPLQPFAEDDLLLVSAREAGNHVIRSRHFVCIVRISRDVAFFMVGSERTTGPFLLIQIGNRRIEGKIPFHEETVCLALLRDEGEAMIHRFLGAVEVAELSIVIDAAAGSGANTEDGFQQLRTAGSNQSIETEDFSFTDVERNVLEPRLVLGEQMLDRENRFLWRIVDRRETMIQRTSNHG